MRQTIVFLLTISFSLFVIGFDCKAQVRQTAATAVRKPQKHALVIGINEYTEGGSMVTGLSGCVNDARSIRDLLMHRFGFPASNIDTLINAQASKAAIVRALRRLEQKAGPNDEVFFFYAGHGMRFENSGAQKAGKTSEAILATDIKSLERTVIFDWELSAVYNRIIAKKAILTVVMDCCNSGDMLMNSLGLQEYVLRPLDYEELGRRGRTIAAEWLFDTRDIDLKQVAAELAADSTSLVYGADSVDASKSMFPIYNRSSGWEFDAALDSMVFDSSLLTRDTRFIPFTGVDLNISNRVPRPHERPDSRILFMAASQGDQLARERVDAQGVKHGVFTRAILDAYERLPAHAPASQLMEFVGNRLAKQYITPNKQKPNYLMDPSRRSLPLTGVSNGLAAQPVFSLLSTSANGIYTLQFNGTEPLKAGYKLRDENNASVVLRISRLLGNGRVEAVNVNRSARGFASGRRFLLSDRTIPSPPKIRLYLPARNYTAAQCNTLYPQYKATPENNGFRPYPQISMASHYIWYDGVKISSGNAVEGFKPANPLTVATMSMRAAATPNNPRRNPDTWQDMHGVFTLLPIPSEILDQVKRLLASNVNVQITNRIEDANFALYGAYKDDGKFVVVCSDEWLKYVRRKELVPRAELTAQEVLFPFHARNLQGNANAVTESILRVAAKLGWMQ